MKKWLKDRDLKPGSGLSHHIATKSGMMTALSAFKTALSVAGVKLEHQDDTSAALLGLMSGAMSTGAAEAGSSNDFVLCKSSCDKQDVADTLGMFATEEADETRPNQDPVDCEDGGSFGKRKRNTADPPNSEGKSQRVCEPDSGVDSLPTHPLGLSSSICVRQSSGSGQLPQHLRPKPIIISSGNGAVGDRLGSAGGGIESQQQQQYVRSSDAAAMEEHDESASALVEILNQLKQQHTPVSAPSVVYNPPSDGIPADKAICFQGLNDQQRIPLHKRQEQLREYCHFSSVSYFTKGYVTVSESGAVDNLRSSTTEKSRPFGNGASVGVSCPSAVVAAVVSTAKSKKSVQYVKSAVEASHGKTGPVPVDATVALLEGIYNSREAPSSPTSMALFMVDKLLQDSSPRAAAASVAAAEDTLPKGMRPPDVPFECLQYFKYLDVASRR